MAGRQNFEGGGGPSKLTKQIFGLATGAALGFLAYYGASKTLRYLEVGHITSLESVEGCWSSSNHCKRTSVMLGNLRVSPLRGNIYCSDREAARSPKK